MQGSSNRQTHDEDCRKEQLKYEHSSRSFRRNESQWAIAEQCAGCRNYRHLESRKGSSQAPEVERVENNDWRDQKEKWQRDLSEYLQKRQSLKGLILLMDIRHPLQEFDTTMLDWAIKGNMPVHILLTKADKLSRMQANNALFAVQKQLKQARLDQLVSIQCFSALKYAGLDELKAKLQSWLAPEQPEQDEEVEAAPQ